MSKSNLPKSVRKYLRNEKARIRARLSDSPDSIKDGETKIQELVQKIFGQYTKNINKKIESRK